MQRRTFLLAIAVIPFISLKDNTKGQLSHDIVNDVHHQYPLKLQDGIETICIDFDAIKKIKKIKSIHIPYQYRKNLQGQKCNDVIF